MHYLSTEEIQHNLLRMLRTFDGVCREHGIRYSLDGGSLLGAVRHSGFIPWDDDMDVIVPRPDYERLIHNPERFSGSLVLATDSTQYYTCPYPFAKLYDTSWRLKESRLSRRFPVEYLSIDVFPADAVPDDEEEALKLLRKQEKLQNSAWWSSSAVGDCKITGPKLFAKKLIATAHRVACPYKKQFSRMCKNASAIEYGSTQRIANLSWACLVPKWIPVGDFDNLVELEFEGNRFPAIPHYDLYLTELYGDYMTLPPKDRQVSHGAAVWAATPVTDDAVMSP